MITILYVFASLVYFGKFILDLVIYNQNANVQVCESKISIWLAIKLCYILGSCSDPTSDGQISVFSVIPGSVMLTRTVQMEDL